MTATSHMQNKIIIKYQGNQDGILAWIEFKKEYGYEGSKDLRIEYLEGIAQKPYTNNTPGGLGSYIDHFQAHIGELETIVPNEYTDAKKKRLLLSNIREADGVAHLLQKCRDDPSMSLETCATYIKEYAALVEKTNQVKPPRSLMHVAESYESDSDHKHEPSTKTMDEVCKIFHTMSKATGLKSAYNTFKSRDFRESLYIPQAIWEELEPSLQEEVLKAKNKAKEKQAKSNNVSKIPDQYPSKRNQESIINLCTSVAEMGFDDEDSTVDEAITSHAYMAKTVRLDPQGLSAPSDDSEQVIQVRAHLEYRRQSWYPNKVYAIADGGEDSCIAGKYAKVLSYTGRYANLVGYNPETTRTEKVPIVTALIKARSTTTDGIPAL